MVRGVKCDLSGECGLCLHWYASCKWPVRLVTCHWKFGDSLKGHLYLDTFGGNDILLINGPVSVLGDPCYKNWTTAVVSFYSFGLLQCLRTHSVYVLVYGVTCQPPALKKNVVPDACVAGRETAHTVVYEVVNTINKITESEMLTY